MPSRRLAAVALAVTLVISGCSDGDDATTATTTAPTETTLPPQVVPLTPLVVELIDAGAEPTQVLEHRIAAGNSWVGTLSFGLSVEGVTTAQVDGESHLDVTSVDDEGTVTAAYGLLGLDVAIGADEPGEPIADALDITGDVVVQADRTVTSATVQTSTSGAVPGVESVATTLDPRLSSLLFPFPTEPIGRGAEWDVSGPLPLFGTVVDFRARARLVSREGGQFDVVIAVTLGSADGEPGPVIDLTGFGEIEGQVTTLGPTVGSITASGTVVLADRGPDPLPMTMDLSIEGR